MAKQYGLILPGTQKKAFAREPPVREQLKPSVFDESSSESDFDEKRPQLKMKKTPFSMGPGAMERRIAKRMQEKALEEDPTVFQYDELYDEMENKRDADLLVKAKEPKKPKYIERLMVTAERRKLENELRIERQVQKEREEEGEQFKDKEAFVTAAYRKKLEEMRKMQEEEKRDEYLEAIGDVTKQQNIDGFYRHLYEQKMGTTKEVNKPGVRTETEAPQKDEEVTYKPIKSGRAPQQRAYRKRHASADDDEEDAAAVSAMHDNKKTHLQNNMDADSDFSIDSSTSESDESDDDAEKPHQNAIDKANDKVSSVPAMDATNIALNLDSLKKPKDEGEQVTNKENKVDNKSSESPTIEIPPVKPKIDKTLIWKKRTVGELFDSAVQRYFQRKAARNA